MHREGLINAIIGLGGSLGTDICTAVMRSFPIGFPKVMVSTLASHDVRPFVGTKDILMFPTISDLNGVNRILKKILRNAALAAAGMAGQEPPESDSPAPLVFIATLGTSEPSALRIKQAVEARGREAIIFHTTGVGGRAMEEMIDEGRAEIVVEVSAQELVAHLFGGDYDAGPDRLSAALKRGVPTLLVPGCSDFIVSGPLAITQKQFPDRQYHQHNAAITVVRTSPGDRNHSSGHGQSLQRGQWSQGGRGASRRLFWVRSTWRPLLDPRHQRYGRIVQEGLGPENPLHVSPHHINDPSSVTS